MIQKWKEMSSHRQRNIVLGVLGAIMLLMVVGYAAFSTQLNINGTSNISSNWDIRITNITSDLHGGATNATEPTYDNENGLTASFSTNLVSPGDYAEYTVTVRNNGDIDATLTDIEISDSKNPAIVFETSGLEEGDNLLKQTEDELIVKVSYNDSVTSQPENVTSNIEVTLTYEQATGGSTPEEPEEGTAGSDLVDQAGTVTSGDGLYADSYEENVYTYRGANPNNYVTFNGEQWRIISVNTADNTIKIMRNGVLSDRQFDTSSGRYQGSSGYCNNNSYGCNIWGSSSTLFDTNLSPITELDRYYYGYGSSKYALPSQEADLNEYLYLNTTYYNGLNATAKNMVKADAVYKAGIVNYASSSNVQQNITEVSSVKWKGKVALIDATEYVRASTNSSCTSVSQGFQSSAPCKNSNWMFNSDVWWTLSPYSNSNSRSVWFVNSGGYFDGINAITSNGVRPVLTLNSNIQITGGTGTSSSPYTLGV